MNEKHASRTTRIVASGDISGQIAVGDHNSLVRSSAPDSQITEAELVQLKQAFADLRVLVGQLVPPERIGAAQERVAELQEAVMAEKPDLTTMEYVKKWFVQNVPSIAGAVTSILVDPIVGKLVGAGGDALVAEFDRRFGASPGA